MKRLYTRSKSGVIPSPPDERDYPVAAILPPVTLPLSIRLDNQISIRDQGWWPTCVGKAGAGIMSAKFGPQLSSVYLYAKCKKIDGIPDEPGTYLRVALKIMQKQGCCLDSMLPYSLMADPLPKITGLHDVQAEQHKIKTYARARGVDDIKRALANGHLLMGCLLVDDAFCFYRGDDKVMGLPQGTVHGYHAIIICGYDDSKKALRIANSWGLKKWGDDGFGWISYDNLMSLQTFPEAWVTEIRASAEEFYSDRIFRDLKRLKKLTGGINMINEKAFWVALIGVLVPILNHFFALGLEVGEIVTIVLPIIALILGVSWKDAEVEKAEINMETELIKAGYYNETE